MILKDHDQEIRQILRNQAAMASALSTLLAQGEATDSQINSLENLLKVMRETRVPGTANPTGTNLPPLFEDDDWLWVAQSLGYVPFSVDDAGFAERHRMDRIIAKILEYRAEDAQWGRGE